MERRRSVWAVATAAAVVLVTGGAGAAQAAPATGPGPLAWTACQGPEVPAELECSSIEVPVDWADPGGRTITLDLARAPATGPERTGSVVVNFGGPGAPGILELGYWLERFDGLRERMDVVTWNPRGSDLRYLPFRECSAGPVVVDIPDRAAYEAAAAAGAEAMRPCRDADPAVFDHLDSATQARDMDAIRAALGEEQVNYFGNSYGGVLGTTYARLFPDRVRTMFLDSIVENTRGVEAANADAYRSLELLFDRFGQWCAAAPECRLHGRDVERVWQDLLAAAEEEPIPVAGSDPPRALDAMALKFFATTFVVHPDTWAEFAAAIDSAAAGDAALFDRSGLGLPPLPAAALATQCADDFRFDGYDDYAAARRDSAALSPNFTGEQEAYTATCAGWPAPVANPAAPLPANGLPPFLGAGPVLEHATVRAVTDQVPGSVTIRFDDTGHGLYLNEENTCVIGHADRYLTEGVLPPVDTVCPPDEP